MLVCIKTGEDAMSKLFWNFKLNIQYFSLQLKFLKTAQTKELFQQ
jgi:hypothetical protein